MPCSHQSLSVPCSGSYHSISLKCFRLDLPHYYSGVVPLLMRKEGRAEIGGRKWGGGGDVS